MTLARTKRSEFTRATKLAAWERCGGKCEECGGKIHRAQYDHIIPAGLGGSNDLDNCACLCGRCHRIKTSERDVPSISKARRIERKRANL